MSFQALIVFVTCTDWREADKLNRAIGKEWPFAKHKIIQKPFIGVGAMVNPSELSTQYEGEDDFDATELEVAVLDAFEKKMPAFSERFQGKAFVFVNVDCFVYPCLFSGKILRSGRIVFKQPSTQDGGDRLLFQAGMHAKGSTMQHLLKFMLE